jgi:GTP-binding protein HflX
VGNPAFEEQIGAVEKILQDLELASKPTLRVFNKMDRIADKALLAALCERFEAIAVSALNPATLSPLMEKLEGLIQSELSGRAVNGCQPTEPGSESDSDGV